MVKVRLTELRPSQKKWKELNEEFRHRLQDSKIARAFREKEERKPADLNIKAILLYIKENPLNSD